MKVFVDMHGDTVPKRGDLVQTAIFTKRERTCMVLRARRMRGRLQRFALWLARWWELEPEMRVRLFRSAQRNGGQIVIMFERYKNKSCTPKHPRVPSPLVIHRRNFR
jgi:hypothetical protein